MSSRWLLLLAGILLVSGCTWPVRQRTNQTVCRIANQPYDISPDNTTQIAKPSTDTRTADRRSAGSGTVQKPATISATTTPDGDQTGAERAQQRNAAVKERNEYHSTTDQRNELRHATIQRATATDSPVDARSALWLERTAAWTQSQVGPSSPDAKKLELNIPSRLPGSETPRAELPQWQDPSRDREIDRMYPELPPIPLEPHMLPGPDGRPYTLTDLQRIAAANSPALRQAVARVQEARGAMLQARTYGNPQGSFFVDPNANNTSSGVRGLGIEQVIKTAGKQKLTAAAAQKDLENAQFALRAARNDLATRVRQAYFALLVDKETLAITRSMAHFTDEIYRLQVGWLRSTQAAAYEPTSLRAQAFTTRLAYQQAIATYIYDWKALVAAIGMRQLPLTQVAGRIDRFIPYYDYDQVLAYVLSNHTDIRIARNLVPQARYKLKLAQVTPIPDLDVAYRYGKDYTAFPFGSYSQFLLSMPLAIWDQNKGNIISAQGALIRASEEQHNTELDLTDRLANAYTNYQNNLYAIDYYRRHILPDLVRYYRGVYARRPVVGDVNVGDLAFAQQNLSQNVTAYLGVLGNLWQSVVSVADFLQTDDLFQMATPRSLPELPDFDELSRWACGHAHIAASCGVVVSGPPVTARGREGDGARGGPEISRPLPLSPSATRNAPAPATTVSSGSKAVTVTNNRRTKDR